MVQVLKNCGPDQLEGHFTFSQEDIAEYIGEVCGIDCDQINSYITDAVSDGLLFRGSSKCKYFDLHQTVNWLQARSLLFEKQLLYASFARSHPTPRLLASGVESRLSVRCCGSYTMELNSRWTSTEADTLCVNISLPVGHNNQKNVRISGLDPPELEAYLDTYNGIIASIPIRLADKAGRRFCYKFDCDISEGFRSPATEATKQAIDTQGEYFGITYPLHYWEKTKQLLEHILGGVKSEPWDDARKVYEWIVHNVKLALTPSPDYSVLDTGSGTCIHLTRLFANLVRLLGCTVREQCGL